MRCFTLLFILLFSALNLSAQDFPMDGTPITACSGFFTDSGGNNGDYQANENFTTTICSDGSTGTHIKLIFSAPGIAAGDQLCFFDGTDVTAPALSCHTDFSPNSPFIVQATAANTSGCLTVTFTSGSGGTGPGWSSIIECIAACQTIVATLASTTPDVFPVDTGYIDICPGDRVFFTAMGEYPQDGIVYNHSDNTSSFTWNFGDGTVALGPNTSHVFTDPGGYTVQVLIEDQFGCTSTNFISQRIRVSTYPDFELAGVPSEGICAGDTVELNAFVNTLDSNFNLSVQPTEGSFVQLGALSDTLLLPDGTGSSYQTSIGFTQFSPGAVLTDPEDIIEVSLFLEHSYGGDLDIELICPNGQSIYMLDYPSGVGSTNFGEPWSTGAIDGMSADLTPGIPYEYTFVYDNADYGTLPSVANDFNYTYTTVNSLYGNGSFTYSDNYFPEGSYLPMETFDGLVGCPLNGEWTIRVQDNLGLDNGWLFRWEIGFDPSLYPVIETFQPNLIDWAWDDNPSIDFYSPDSISAILNNAGTTNFTFAVNDDFGCTFDTTVTVTALPPTHPDCFSCESTISTIPDTIICNGDAATLAGSDGIPLNDLEITFGASSGTEFDGSNFPPGNPIASDINVDYVNPTTLTDPLAQIASVCLNIEHSFDADVEIRLRAPNGATIELSTDNGGSGDDYTNTCFSPSATNPITGGSPPFTGSWIPEGDWDDLIGSPIDGDWTLLVADDQNGFGGEFIDWSITFNSTNEVTYNWSSAATLSCNNCPDPEATPTATTEYILNAIDAYGCTITDTVTVTVANGFDAPILNCSNSDGGNLTIDWLPVNGANSYEVSLDGGMTWMPASGMLSHTVPGLSDGDIVDILVQVDTVGILCPIETGSIQCTYSDPCLFDLSISIANTAPPTCWNNSDGIVSLDVANPVNPMSYSLDGVSNSMTPSFSGVSAGSHVIYVVDGIGCLDSITFDLTAPDSIELAFTPTDASCFGECSGEATVSAIGGSGNINYTWSDVAGTTLPTAADLCAGTYSVLATDANGCTNVDSVAIDQATELSITNLAPIDVTCFGEATGSIDVDVEGGTAPYNYQWNDPATQITELATDLPQGTFTIVVTDDNGCIAVDSAAIIQPDSALSVTVLQTLVGCADAMEGEAEVMAAGGTMGYSYEWSTGAFSNTITNLEDINYTVTVTDANGCMEEGSIQVDELLPIVVNLSGEDPTCFEGADGVVMIDTVFGGTGNYTYEWNNGTLAPDSILNALTADDYNLLVTDDQGCEMTSSFTLNAPEEITLITDLNLPSCSGFNDGTATVVNVLGGTPTYTYQWDNNAGNQTSATAMTLGSGSYTVTVTDINGCTGETEINIDDPTTLQISFEVEDVDCPGESGGSIRALINGGTPIYTYEWNNGASTAMIDSVGTGDYFVTITDANGCFVEESVSVESPEPLVGNLEINDVTCFGDDDGLIRVSMTGGTPPYQYAIDAEELSSSNTMIRLLPGSYEIFVQDAQGCTWAEEAVVNEPEEFQVNAGPDEVTIILGDSIQLIPGQTNSAGFVNYDWIEPYPDAYSCVPDFLNECDRPFVGPFNTTTFELFGVDANGCESTDEIIVRVRKLRDVFVATGFTPDGDGTNDLLMLHGPENVWVLQFSVFDRWGNKVYDYQALDDVIDEESVIVNDPTFGWDGNFREEPMPSGVYVWYAEVIYLDGFKKIFKGNTTIIR